MSLLSELARDGDVAVSQLGGKAAGLARLWSADLPVPDGFVVHVEESPVSDALVAWLATHPGPFVVRSSATCEDLAVTRAPGIFESYRDTPVERVADRVADVRASLLAPTALAYLEARGLPASDVGMAVIVQQQITCRVAGSSYSRDPDDTDRLLIEAEQGRVMVAVDRASGDVLARAGNLADRHVAAITRASLTVEELFGAPVDVEWVIDPQDDLWLVQARLAPLSARAPSPWAHAADLEFSRQEPEVVWTWDATHNPAPLSPAQAGLVHLVAQSTQSARQRVVAGYLYTAPTSANLKLVAPPDLPAHVADHIVPRLEAVLDRLDGEPGLEEALSAYVDFCRIYADELSPSLAAARKEHRAAGAMCVRDSLALHDHAEHIFSVWDVAAPALSETPDALARVSVALNARESNISMRDKSLAQAVADIAEQDDLLFARAQAGLRRALCNVAHGWSLPPNDIFYLPLDKVRQAVRNGAPHPSFVDRARAARHEFARRASRTPPLHVIGGQGLFRPRQHTAGIFVGRGFGGLVRGRVAVFPRTDELPKNAVLVTATVIPPMVALAVGACAIVTEHGGLLGHGAALARELQIPCVVGAHGAASLTEGTPVLVDGQAGLVVKTGR